MFGEYFFPGTVVLLKFVLRLVVNQAASKVDFFRALLSFPIDLVFLALSFSAIMLARTQTGPIHIDTKTQLSVFIAFIVAAVIVTTFSKVSDHKFNVDKSLTCIGWMLPAYLVSIYSLYISIAAV